MTYNLHEFSPQTSAPVVLDFDTQTVARGFASATGRMEANAASKVLSGAAHRRPFDDISKAVAAAKKWTSQVAMRLPSEFKARIFWQLDRLHDEAEWYDGNAPINLESYKSLIRAYLGQDIGGKASIALMPNGNVIAIWQHDKNKLSIEFMAEDRVRYLVSQPIDEITERVAGDTKISRLAEVLAPFQPAAWFNGC